MLFSLTLQRLKEVFAHVGIAKAARVDKSCNKVGFIESDVYYEGIAIYILLPSLSPCSLRLVTTVPQVALTLVRVSRTASSCPNRYPKRPNLRNRLGLPDRNRSHCSIPDHRHSRAYRS
jgi:hypothetical protein